MCMLFSMVCTSQSPASAGAGDLRVIPPELPKYGSRLFRRETLRCKKKKPNRN